MALIKWRNRNEWDPFRDLLAVQDNINKLFAGSLPARAEGGFAWNPAVDIYRDGDNYVLKSEMPGLNKDDIDISIQDNVLTIKGSKKDEKEISEDDYYHSERVFGAFQRSFRLPEQVDSKAIKAGFKDGVLEVSMPVAEEAKPKQIKVDVE